MVYADYGYYTDTFYGSKIPADAFDAASKRASEYLDYITMHRIKETTETVKDACCACAELIYSSNTATDENGTELASQSVGSWSVSYRSAAEVREAKNAELYATVQKYIGHTGLLYRGGCNRCILPTL